MSQKSLAASVDDNRLKAHHLRFARPRALGRKANDEFAVPLCAWAAPRENPPQSEFSNGLLQSCKMDTDALDNAGYRLIDIVTGEKVASIYATLKDFGAGDEDSEPGGEARKHRRPKPEPVMVLKSTQLCR